MINFDYWYYPGDRKIKIMKFTDRDGKELIVRYNAGGYPEHERRSAYRPSWPTEVYSLFQIDIVGRIYINAHCVEFVKLPTGELF